MKTCIKKYILELNKYLSARPNLKQWVWFFALWLFGLLTVMVVTYPLKLLIKLAS